jgi:hypothetical protein
MIARHISESQARDTGLAAVLVLLFFARLTGSEGLILPAMGVLVLTMLWPTLFRPLGVVWFTLANVLRRVVSTVLLTVLFVVIAVPIGWVRRLAGVDPLRLRQWKRGNQSVFVERDHLFSAKDLERPY